MFTIKIDGQQRAMRVRSSGFWNIEKADLYVSKFCEGIQDCRRQFGAARALVDAREAAVHTQETAKRLGTLGDLFDQPGDRLAIVTTSSLKKQQVSRTLPACGQAFLSLNAAETWLFAFDAV